MPEYLSEFKRIPESERTAEAGRIRTKYPDRCCVIVTKAPGTDAPDIDRHKYLVPGDITVGQFTYVIRKRIKVNSEKAIFIFIQGTLPASSATISSVYEEKKASDGFMYVTYAAENTFG
jgi:GABA(A) receptor-associated protein